MSIVNLVAVKAYGEFEFWFALIKIVTILAMIVSGLGMIIFFGFGNGGASVGISNLWSHGGFFFPNGFQGVLMSLQMVFFFAYLGIEMIGVTAGEAKNPKKNRWLKRSIPYFGES